MRIRHLCGAILTLFLATSTFAAPAHDVRAPYPRVTQTPIEFHLATFPEHQQAVASYEMPELKADTLHEVPAAAAADMKDPLKYSVWVLIGLGPIMWIWLAFFPRIRRK